MKLEKGFKGKIIAHTIKVFSPYNNEEVKKKNKTDITDNFIRNSFRFYIYWRLGIYLF